jgi:DNA transformation protein
MQNEFVEYLLEMLEPFGDVQARAMFGGFGVYKQGLMFGIVDRDTLYLKADDENRPYLESMGLKAFTYKRQDKEVALSYYQIPYEAIDDSDRLCELAKKAYDAALRAAETKSEKGYECF